MKKTLKILLKKNFKPLNMKDTGFGVDEENLSDLCHQQESNFEIMNVGPHRIGRDRWSAHNPYDSETFRRGGTGLFSTSEDYFHLLECCYQVNLKVVKLYYQEIWLNL